MPAQPDGDPVPLDGALPDSALAELDRPLSFYIHVPFCASRCGYCDFNTYTLDQTGGSGPTDWLTAAHREIELARTVLAGQHAPVQTIFLGGGTPTMIPAADLGGLVAHVDELFGIAPDAEITTEANPETLNAEVLDGLLVGGFNRLSMGMQSGREHVLKVLDRVHTPGRALEMARLAHERGFGNVSLDLIYGTPGESMHDWRASLEQALSVAPEHISAYALIVEDGTALARRIKHGELPMTDDDDLADKYLVAEQILTADGFENYEISNWSRDRDTRAHHNEAYWLGNNWWGIGPGAHSHVGGVRWWNLKHPARYAAALADGHTPAQARELLDPDTRREERVLLELRLADGLPVDVLTASEQARLGGFAERGLVTVNDRVRLTLDGRLLADGVVRDLLD